MSGRRISRTWLALALAWVSSLALLWGSLALVTGCGALERRIQVEAIRGPLERVLDRVELYAAADEELGAEALDELELANAALRVLLPLEQVEARQLEAAGWDPLADYHDDQVAADPVLTDLERRVYIGDAFAVSRVLEAARGD